MIHARKARRAISNSQRRSSTMNRTENPRKVLGKGLNALLSARTQAPPPAPIEPAQPTEAALSVPIDSIDPNPLQPRRISEAGPLADLAQSIRSNGIVP